MCRLERALAAGARRRFRFLLRCVTGITLAVVDMSENRSGGRSADRACRSALLLIVVGAVAAGCCASRPRSKSHRSKRRTRPRSTSICFLTGPTSTVQVTRPVLRASVEGRRNRNFVGAERQGRPLSLCSRGEGASRHPPSRTRKLERRPRAAGPARGDVGHARDDDRSAQSRSVDREWQDARAARRCDPSRTGSRRQPDRLIKSDPRGPLRSARPPSPRPSRKEPMYRVRSCSTRPASAGNCRRC